MGWPKIQEKELHIYDVVEHLKATVSAQKQIVTFPSNKIYPNCVGQKSNDFFLSSQTKRDVLCKIKIKNISLQNAGNGKEFQISIINAQKLAKKLTI
jgi:hypothetical protein